jgi:hypothetical protein
MTRLLAISGLCLICSTGALAADEPRLIHFTVTIASAANDKLRPEMDAKEIVKTIGELEKSNELASLTRLRFAAIEQEMAKFQFGETVPIITGRTSAGGRGGPGTPGGGFPGGAPAFGGQSVSFSRGQVGTVIGAVARVVDGGVVAQLEIEQTRQDAPPPGDDSPIPPKSATLSFKSAVRIPVGETALLAGLQERAANEIKRTVILVSATLPDGAAKGARVDGELKIFALKQIRADGLRDVLMQLFPDTPLTLAADERSNTLVVRGTHEQLEIIEALSLRLDQEKP